MAYGKSIELFLVNGTADSLIIAELSNWNGKAIKIPRIEVSSCERDDITQAGVYFLFCKEDDGSDSVYIGEAENVKERLVQHLRDYQAEKEKYYWNTAVVFIGRDLNKALIRYLENRFVEIARTSKRYLVLTKNTYRNTVMKEWLYVPFMPEKPGAHPGIKESIYILQKRLASTNNDVEQELFGAMKSMLEYVDKKNADTRYFFGTDDFDHVWEKMIDKAFGVEDKEKYFPRTRWLLDYGQDKEKRPLYPDSIMVYKDKYYVLDAKCYRYGWTGNPDHLPNGTDINKQITYGEYLEKARGVKNEDLFNCFIMPYNMNDNLFHLTSTVGNIGEAVGDWRYDSSNPKMKNYERIQGIVMDTRYLMYNYIGTPEQQKKELAECIEKVLARGLVSKPKK